MIYIHRGSILGRNKINSNCGPNGFTRLNMQPKNARQCFYNAILCKYWIRKYLYNSGQTKHIYKAMELNRTCYSIPRRPVTQNFHQSYLMLSRNINMGDTILNPLSSCWQSNSHAWSNGFKIRIKGFFFGNLVVSNLPGRMFFSDFRFFIWHCM